MTKRDELIALGGVGAKVRELEWNEYTDERGDPDRWDAETLAGTFYGIALLVDGFSIEYDYTAVAKGLDDLEAAKAAAQADYEARIKSALVEVPADAGMREAFVRVLASLAAAISILERTPKAKRAVASDKMFDQMLDDYRKALEAGRSALTAPPADAGMREAFVRVLASLDAAIKDRISDLERQLAAETERCACIAQDNRQHSNQIVMRTLEAESAYEEACDDIAAAIRGGAK